MASVAAQIPHTNLSELRTRRRHRQGVVFVSRQHAPLVLAFSPPCLWLRVSIGERVKLGCHGARDPALLRRPLVPSPSTEDDDEDGDEGLGGDEAPVEESRPEAGEQARSGVGRRRKKDDWVDWEDMILQDTVPLVSFVRMILHSGKYESGDRLSPEHENTIMERLLPYHPEFEKKIGPGVDYLTIGYHPEFENSRCMFIVRKDGQSVDISYWKCIKGLIKKNYPLYADSFIVRHFRSRRYND